jgi:hypothetical protein
MRPFDPRDDTKLRPPLYLKKKYVKVFLKRSILPTLPCTVALCEDVKFELIGAISCDCLVPSSIIRVNTTGHTVRHNSGKAPLSALTSVGGEVRQPYRLPEHIAAIRTIRYPG